MAVPVASLPDTGDTPFVNSIRAHIPLNKGVGVDSYPANDDYFANNGATYPWYSGATAPNGVYDANTDKTWASWEAWDGQNRVTECKVYDHATGLWGSTYKIAICSVDGVPLDTDDHGVPALVRDADGYWHCFGQSHISPVYHYVTVAPDDPSSWQPRPKIGSVLSYPHPTVIGSTLYVFFRFTDAPNTKHTLVLYTATLTAGVEGAWTGPIAIADGGYNSRWYSGNHELVSGKIHMVNTIADFGDINRRNVYYLIYDPATGEVSNVSGSVTTAAGSLPIDITTLDASYRIVTQTTNGGNIPNLCFDALGDPHIIYMDGVPDSTSFGVYHITRTAGAWSSPYLLGTSYSADSGYTITPLTSGVKAYWTQQRGRPSWYSGSGRRDGGNVWTATRSGAGAWGSPSLLQGAHDFALGEPAMVRFGDPDFRVMWEEVVQDSTPSGALRMWAYGDGGYLKAASVTVSPAVIFWSLVKKWTGITLSASNLKATATANGDNMGRTTFPAALNGKVYMEFVADAVTTPGSYGVGVVGQTFAFAGTGYLGTNTVSFGYFGDGTNYRDGANRGTTVSYGAGANIGMALDTVNRKVWFRKNGGNWNNSGSDDPATNTGGFDISSITGPLYPAYDLGKLNDAVTAKFATAAWAYSAPSGFAAMS